jgi:hypothetical protein
MLFQAAVQKSSRRLLMYSRLVQSFNFLLSGLQVQGFVQACSQVNQQAPSLTGNMFILF